MRNFHLYDIKFCVIYPKIQVKLPLISHFYRFTNREKEIRKDK